jgi:hypothetical protein
MLSATGHFDRAIAICAVRRLSRPTENLLIVINAGYLASS